MTKKVFYLTGMILITVALVIFSMSTFSSAKDPRADYREQHRNARLSVEPQVVVYLFENANFQGHYRVLINNEPDFNNINFNDTVSSIKVYAVPGSPNVRIEFFESANYRGRHISLHPGQEIEDLSQIDFNDVISSMQIK